MLETIAPHFENWAQQHDIIQRSTEFFYEMVRKLNEDDPGTLLLKIKNTSYDPRLVDLERRNIAFFMNQQARDPYYVAAAFIFYYDSRDVGIYRAIFNMTGEHIDDTWKHS